MFNKYLKVDFKVNKHFESFIINHSFYLTIDKLDGFYYLPFIRNLSRRIREILALWNNRNQFEFLYTFLKCIFMHVFSIYIIPPQGMYVCLLRIILEH